MRVIDSHIHYFKDSTWFPEGWNRDVAMREALNTWPQKDYKKLMEEGSGFGTESHEPVDPDGSRLIQDAQDCGIDVSIILPIDIGLTYEEDAPASIEEINRGSMDVADKYPGKVYSYCGVDPRRPNAVELFEKVITQWGGKGLKLYPPCGFIPNDPICFPLYNKAVELDVPILFHCGPTWAFGWRGGYSHPRYLEDVAVQFPDLKIIIGHSGIQTLSGNAWWEEALGIAWGKFNVYLGIGGWQEKVASMTHKIPEFLHKLRIMCDTVGAHRIVWGTDLPGFELPHDKIEAIHYTRILRNLVEVGDEHGVVFSREEVELIANGNSERINRL